MTVPVGTLLEDMERAAEEVLQQDAAFRETLYALKSEIHRDPCVRLAMRELRAAGHKAFTSFVPHLSVWVRTGEGLFALPPKTETASIPAMGEIGKLRDELRKAASSAIVAGNSMSS